MATKRFYLTRTAAQVTPGQALGTWHKTDSSVLNNPQLLGNDPGGVTGVSTVSETSGTQPYRVLLGQWVSPPADADGTLPQQDWTVTVAGAESTATADMKLLFGAWVANDGGMLAQLFTFVSPTELPAGSTVGDTVARQVVIDSDYINDAEIQAGQRIVFEVGYQAANTSTVSRSGTVVLGGTATPDLANGDTDDDVFRPGWVDIAVSAGLTFGEDDDGGDPVDDGTAAGAHGWGNPIAEWSDEFDYTGPPNPAKWESYDGPGHDGNGVRDPDANTVQDGYLRITGLANGNSGGLASKFNQQYGRWECRARVTPAPGASGNPYHAVLIVWPESDLWPDDGEYDFFEVDVEDERATAFLHYPYPDEESPAQQEQATSDPVDLTEWHHYGFEWTSAGLTGYLDGVQWFHYAGGAGPFDRRNIQTMPSGHLTIQLDDFFPAAGLQKAYMDVEWAHVFTLTPDIDPEDPGDPGSPGGGSAPSRTRGFLAIL